MAKDKKKRELNEQSMGLKQNLEDLIRFYCSTLAEVAHDNIQMPCPTGEMFRKIENINASYRELTAKYEIPEKEQKQFKANYQHAHSLRAYISCEGEWR